MEPQKMTRRRVLHLEFLAVVVVAATLLHCAAARRTFVVGDGLGWTVPPNPNTYAIWASNHSFAVNDILLFKFESGNHTVAKVSKEAYEACNSSAAPMFIRRQSPAFIFLNTTGDKFFIDTVGDHCLKGQKVAVKVNPLAPGPPQQPPPPANNPPSNTPPPSTPPASPSPPPGAPAAPPSGSPPPITSTPSPALPPQAAAAPPLSSSSPPTSTAPPLSSKPPPPPPPPRSAAASIGASVGAVFVSFALVYLVWN